MSKAPGLKPGRYNGKIKSKDTGLKTRRYNGRYNGRVKDRTLKTKGCGTRNSTIA
jgi:hypothetical protein